MIGGDRRAASRIAGGGVGVPETRQDRVCRHPWLHFARYPHSAWATPQAGGAKFCLIFLFVSGSFIEGNPNGESRIVFRLRTVFVGSWVEASASGSRRLG
jgi:hypothetical protein